MIIAQLIHAMAYHQLIKCLSHYSPEWLAYTQREAQANLAAGTVILYNPPHLPAVGLLAKAV
ncbi:MAG: hypothetical protein AB2992_04495 [Candidatus Symbiodolus clandestinus]